VGEQICDEPPVVESRGNEGDEAQWKIWMKKILDSFNQHMLLQEQHARSDGQW